MNEVDLEATLRERRSAETRSLIIDAYLRMAQTENGASISVPAVAERAGVSVRTVYRYFPTKAELADEAAAAWGDRVLQRSFGGDKIDRENFGEFLAVLWGEFAAALPSVLAEHSTPSGRDLRRGRLPAARAMAGGALDGVGAAADADLVDLLVAVTSSSMFIELVDRMGHTPQHAVALATRAVEALLEGSTQ